MKNNFNNQFNDCMDKINKIAKSKGWQNGKDWANFAVKVKLISVSTKIDFENAHDLRNRMDHGNAKDIVVHQETLSKVQKFLHIIESKIRENKMAGKKGFSANDKKSEVRKENNNILYGKHLRNNTGEKQNFSQTEQKYIRDLMWKIYVSFRNDEFGKAAYAIYSSDESIDKCLNLLLSVKIGLSYNNDRYKAAEYYESLKSFRIPEKTTHYFSQTEQKYIRDLMWKIYVSFRNDEFGKAAYTIYQSEEPFYKNKGLLYVVKNGLYANRTRYHVSDFYGILKAFV